MTVLHIIQAINKKTKKVTSVAVINNYYRDGRNGYKPQDISANADLLDDEQFKDRYDALS